MSTKVIRLSNATRPRVNRPRSNAQQLADLGGEKPYGHPTLKLGPRGKVLFEVCQVWVELHTQDLYVIRALSLRSNGKTYEVSLSRYGSTAIERVLSETSLRQTMRVWDTAPEFFASCMAKVRKAIEDGEGVPFGITTVDDAAEFFGLDPETGKRVD